LNGKSDLYPLQHFIMRLVLHCWAMQNRFQQNFGGNNTEYCVKCGAKLADGICPDCTVETSYTETADSNNRFRNYLMNPDEKIISILGNNYLQNFLNGQMFSQGFSVVTDKRVYFKGTVFSAIEGKLQKTKESKAVNVRDVTGVTVTYNSPIRYVVFAILCLLAGIMLSSSFMGGWGFFLGFVAAVINVVLFVLGRVTLLLIQYAGGAIGFDVKWFPEKESITYQKSLFLAKDKIIENKQ